MAGNRADALAATTAIRRRKASERRFIRFIICTLKVLFLEQALKCRSRFLRSVVIQACVVCRAVWVVDSKLHSTFSPVLDLILWQHPDCFSCRQQRLLCAAHAYCLWCLRPDALVMCCADVSWTWSLTDCCWPDQQSQQRMTARRTCLRLTE